MLSWLNQFSIFCLLDNHNYNFTDPSFECLLAAGSTKTLQTSAGNAFEDLSYFVTGEKDWIFGHLGYDLKNEIENLSSDNRDDIKFPDIFFFVPEIVLILKMNSLEIGLIKGDHDIIFNDILSTPAATESLKPSAHKIKRRFSKKKYLETIQQIQQHIRRGDCYEINFCQEFYAENCRINPLDIYLKLCNISPNPFAAYYKIKDKYLICSSPERYLKKVGNKILTQPIKGTSRRNFNNKTEDEENKKNLLRSKKETSENVMVVDLVRNDLSKVCIDGSVKVEELFGLYSFPHVHQMISTVIGTINAQISLSDILKATFPMGSMTGVPKKSVLQLIEKYEKTKRGLFSGALGYITPGGDFDFNVVIRSILYNATNKYLSIPVGSAITFYSDADKEYEECLIKLEAMKKAIE